MNLKIYKKLVELPYFTLTTVLSLSGNSENSVNQGLKEYTNNGQLIRLKNGYYTSRDFCLNHKHQPEFFAYLAYILLSPSYLSMEFILRKADVLTDATFGYSSITTKKTSSFENPFGRYSYHNIKEELFTGYHENYFLTYKYYEASLAKAFFDYIYIHKNIDFSGKSDPVEEYRFNLSAFNSDDIIELKGLLDLNSNKRVQLIIKHIIENAPYN